MVDLIGSILPSYKYWKVIFYSGSEQDITYSVNGQFVVIYNTIYGLYENVLSIDVSVWCIFFNTNRIIYCDTVPLSISLQYLHIIDSHTLKKALHLTSVLINICQGYKMSQIFSATTRESGHLLIFSPFVLCRFRYCQNFQEW